MLRSVGHGRLVLIDCVFSTMSSWHISDCHETCGARPKKCERLDDKKCFLEQMASQFVKTRHVNVWEELRLERLHEPDVNNCSSPQIRSM